MKTPFSFFSIGLGASLLLSNCGENQSNPDYNPAVGPFDENGNYVEAWADNPPTSRRTRKTTLKPKEISPPKPKAKTTSRPKPNPKPAPKAAPKPKPKPKPVKLKPRSIRHSVKKGDTLYGLARKYGTTVSKIQKANGLRGTKIFAGTSLLIPR